jgi:hypothetical protein
MTQQHPITPPPELVEQWAHLPADWNTVAFLIAQWGADQELEACCDHMRDYQWGFVDLPDGTKIHRAIYLQQTRRPKQPSLKEQALEIVRGTPVNSAGLYSYEHVEIIRRALEQLDD